MKRQMWVQLVVDDRAPHLTGGWDTYLPHLTAILFIEGERPPFPAWELDDGRSNQRFLWLLEALQ